MFLFVISALFVNQVISACTMTGGEIYDNYNYSSIVNFLLLINRIFAPVFLIFFACAKNTAIISIGKYRLPNCNIMTELTPCARAQMYQR